LRRPELARDARAILDEILPLMRDVAKSPQGNGQKHSEPFHARVFATALPPAKARALKNALLVLEDEAADVHNPAYARRLLDASRSHGSSASGAKRSPEGASP
jgi:hypothetical protein